MVIVCRFHDTHATNHCLIIASSSSEAARCWYFSNEWKLMKTEMSVDSPDPGCPACIGRRAKYSSLLSYKDHSLPLGAGWFTLERWSEIMRNVTSGGETKRAEDRDALYLKE